MIPLYELYPSQQEDLKFFSEWGRSANFSEPGVGKTPVAVRLVQELDGLPCLIVCPNSVRYHWEEEFQKFWKGEPPKVVQYEGSPKNRNNLPDFDILITNYQLFRIDFKGYFFQLHFKMTIFDEAHHLKNRKAQTTKCAYKLKSDYMHLITGTPITNQFDDMWSYLHLLFPDQFRSYWKFINRYGKLVNNGFGTEIVGVRQDRLPQLTNIIQQFSIRRRKKDVYPELPDKTYQTIHVELTPAQRKVYDEMKQFMIASLEDQTVEVPNVVSQLIRLRQIALTPQLAGFDNQDSAKLSALLEILESRKLAGKQTVVMSEFRQWVDILEKSLHDAGLTTVRITGAENHKQQRAAQQAFQKHQADVALCTIKAAGLGIDLTVADTVIFTDISWREVDNVQAEDRIHRATQTQKAHIIRLFAKNTIDPIIFDRTLLKAITAKQVLSDEQVTHLKDLLVS